MHKLISLIIRARVDLTVITPEYFTKWLCCIDLFLKHVFYSENENEGITQGTRLRSRMLYEW